MFSYALYKVVHFVGIFATIAALGGVVLHVHNGGDKSSNRARAMVAATHGIGLFLTLLGGFGMLARLQLDFMSVPWVHAKLLVWLVLGALITVAYRAPGASKLLWFGVPVLTGVAAWLAVAKPF